MSTENTTVFKKENLDQCLKELAKEYKRLVRKQMPAEIILVGGAAILENYGFRDMTTDVDAVIETASAMKDAIRAGERSAKELLVDFQEEYPDTLKQENVNSVLQSLERLKKKRDDPE